MIPVVTNADDFGLSEGVCSGIVKAIQAGGLTATTAMACVPGAMERLARWAPAIPGRIGAHLQLTSGRPLLPPERVPSLVDADGRFPDSRKKVTAPQTSEIFAEWQAQIELLVRVGIEPTHLDSHHHIHRLPAAFPAFCEIAKRFSVPARAIDAQMRSQLQAEGIPCVGETITGWYGGELSAASMIMLLRQSAEAHPDAESFEVMCHPGLVDSSLAFLSKYVQDRERELAVFLSGNLRRELEAAGFSLSTIAEAVRFPAAAVDLRH